MKRGLILVIAVAFLVVFGVAAFFLARSGSKDTVQDPVLKVWAPYDEKEVYEEIGKTFFAETGIRVDFTHVKADNAKDYEAKVVDGIASGEGPDIWLIRTDWLGKHEGKLLPMSTALKWSTDGKVSEAEALQAVFGKNVIAQNSVGSTQYAIPLAVDSLALYVNSRVVSEVQFALEEANDPRAETLESTPVTWGDVDAWSQILTQRGGGGFARSGLAIGTVDNTYAPIDVYLALLNQKGGRLYDPSSREPVLHLVNEDSAVPGQQALEALRPFSDPGSPHYSWNTSAGDPVKAFVEGRLAMMLGFSSLRFDILEQKRDFTDYYVTALPQQQDIRIPSDKRVDHAAYWTHTVPKTSSFPEQAWSFVKYLTLLGNQEYYTNQTLKPVLGMLGEVESPENDFLPDPRIFTAQVVTAPAIHKPDWLFVDETLQLMLKSVFDGSRTPQIALDTAAATLKETE